MADIEILEVKMVEIFDAIAMSDLPVLDFWIFKDFNGMICWKTCDFHLIIDF